MLLETLSINKLKTLLYGINLGFEASVFYLWYGLVGLLMGDFSNDLLLNA